jgi:hypothetical protein
MKQEILVLMKQQLKEIADKLTFENYKDMEQQVHRVFTILESSESMMDSPVHQTSILDDEEKIGYPPLITKILEEEPEPDMTMEELLELEEEEKEEEQGQVIDGSEIYRFERRIKGGVIPEIHAFVPEMKIRELGLSHGDLVTAKFLFAPDNGPKRYEYELIEKADPPTSPENIVEVNMGIVSYEPNRGRYCIRRTVNSDEIIFEGEKVVLPISDEDMDNSSLDLREGSVVNAAFYANNPDYTRVRWAYSTDEIPAGTSTPKNSSYYKKKEDSSKEVEQIFEGKTICVLGYEPGWTAYREEVEKRGGELLTLTGRESFDTIFGTIDKSDCLIMILGHVGHTGTIFSVDHCKKNNIPQTSLKTFGRSSFVNAAAELLEK